MCGVADGASIAVNYLGWRCGADDASQPSKFSHLSRLSLATAILLVSSRPNGLHPPRSLHHCHHSQFQGRKRQCTTLYERTWWRDQKLEECRAFKDKPPNITFTAGCQVFLSPASVSKEAQHHPLIRHTMSHWEISQCRRLHRGVAVSK